MSNRARQAASLSEHPYGGAAWPSRSDDGIYMLTDSMATDHTESDKWHSAAE